MHILVYKTTYLRKKNFFNILVEIFFSNIGNNLYNFFALENSKKIWGSIENERSIFTKKQSHVFPSYVMGFGNKK